MNILHINTQDSGGAFQAAYRLHQGLLEQAVNSDFLVLYNTQPRNRVHAFLEYQTSFLNKLRNSVKYRWITQRNNALIKDKPSTQFSFAHTAFDIANHPLVQKADVIHLHWVANFLDYASFFRKIKKPVVWTLHDMNPFSGGFHYKTYESEVYHHLDKKVNTQKQKALEKARSLHIVAPSKWLLNASKQSTTLKRFPHHHIPYGLDTQLFKPLSKSESRTVLDLPKGAKIILFVAESLNDQRKGVAYLLEALQYLKEYPLYLALLGGGKTIQLIHPHKSMGFVEDITKIVNIYAAADVFVIPSQEDNLPNTVLESLACGTPVIGFDIGGIPDMVNHGKNGLTTPPFDTQKLAENIKKILYDEDLKKEMQINARRTVEDHFYLALQAKKYVSLYQKILSDKID